MSGIGFNHSLINEFYSNKTVLITGGTGLVGKVIVYKILRSIESIKKVYILIREKNGKNYLERFNDLITKSRDLFTNIEKQSLEKLVPIDGDVSLPGLGLNEENRKLILKEVSIVFNAAADISFETDLRYQILDNFLLKIVLFIIFDISRGQVLTNVGSTKEVIDLCRKLEAFDVLLHVSTAYSNPQQIVTEEKIYRSHINPIELLELSRYLLKIF